MTGQRGRPKLADEAYDEIADVLTRESRRLARENCEPPNRGTEATEHGGAAVKDRISEIEESWLRHETIEAQDVRYLVGVAKAARDLRNEVTMRGFIPEASDVAAAMDRLHEALEEGE